MAELANESVLEKSQCQKSMIIKIGTDQKGFTGALTYKTGHRNNILFQKT